MGLSYIQGTVRGPAGDHTVRFLIDSGAMYSLLPYDVWRAIGLTAKRELDFALVDGTTIRRAVSECHISLPQGEAHTPVILGERVTTSRCSGSSHWRSLASSSIRSGARCIPCVHSWCSQQPSTRLTLSGLLGTTQMNSKGPSTTS